MDINWIGIIVAAIAYMVVGAIWYSPKVFGNDWMKLSKVSMENTAESGKLYVGAFISALIMAWVLAMVIDYAGAFTVIGGAIIGFFMWLGFVLTTHFETVLWGKRPWKLFFINAGCMLVTLVLMGAIIGGLA